MIISIEGLPPIVVQEIDKELRTNVREGEQQASAEIEINRAYETKNRNVKENKNKPVKDNQQNEGQKKIDFDELAKNIKGLLGNDDLSIEFSRDKELNKLILKIIDKKTEELIKQFPPEITLKIARIVASTFGSGQVTNVKV